MSKDKKEKKITHDQNFKNMILDYPRESLMFFAEPEAFDLAPDAKITPVRQEQLKDRLGDPFKELDTPLLVEWPDGSRAGIVFVAEEETEPGIFSIHRLARYCLHLSELLNTNRVVPVTIFLRPGDHPTSLALKSDRDTYLQFRFISSDLGRIPAELHVASQNIVARLNLPNMSYPPEKKVEMYARAREGLVQLEPSPNKRIKYADFIDFYAGLDESEIERFEKEFLPESRYKEELMGLNQKLREEGRKEGRKEERKQMLHRLLTLRFHEIPDWAEELLNKAELGELGRWTDRILDAESVEDVFENWA